MKIVPYSLLQAKVGPGGPEMAVSGASCPLVSYGLPAPPATVEPRRSGHSGQALVAD
jgi:hypothetical protein